MEVVGLQMQRLFKKWSPLVLVLHFVNPLPPTTTNPKEPTTPFDEGNHPLTQKQLVNYLIHTGDIKTPKVAETMLYIDRQTFARQSKYGIWPLEIGYGAKISAPNIHALALELLQNQLKPGNKALDIGSGSGYLTVCMAYMMGKGGEAIGIDHMSELTDYAINNMLRASIDTDNSGSVRFITGEGRFGYPDEAPYDAIYVGGAIPEIPQTLVDQIKVNGRMVVPVGLDMDRQNLTIVDKDHQGNVRMSLYDYVFYYALEDRDKQWTAEMQKEEEELWAAATEGT